jgi:hypothetical protein
VAIVPEKYRDCPRSSSGHLHPDQYWYGTIRDIRGQLKQNKTWLAVTWFYSVKDLEELVEEFEEFV